MVAVPVTNLGGREGGREGGERNEMEVLEGDPSASGQKQGKERREGGREGGRKGGYLDVVGVRVRVAFDQVVSHPFQTVQGVVQLSGVLPGVVKFMHTPGKCGGAKIQRRS